MLASADDDPIGEWCMFSTALGRLRAVAFVEGVSYVILLGIAMPLKYAFGMPEAVRVVGMLHGVLFICLLPVLLQAQMDRKWGLRFSILVFIASLVPLGAFWMDRRLKALSIEKTH